MQRQGVHPVLLVGILSLAGSALLEWLAYPSLSGRFLEGFLDGLGVMCLYGYLLAIRMRRLWQS